MCARPRVDGIELNICFTCVSHSQAFFDDDLSKIKNLNAPVRPRRDFNQLTDGRNCSGLVSGNTA